MNQEQQEQTQWMIYRGSGLEQNADDRITRLPPPPPWRKFDAERRNPERGANYLATPEQIQLVNLALYLRRPLLITGKPGTGKSSLAYAVAHELKLGPVLRWPITSRAALAEGLYRYDALGRLQEAQLYRRKAVEIGHYLSLGPLGTALLPGDRPRVLLIDEIDKSDIDLPNDLLNIFEEGEYEIPELARHPQAEIPIRLFESDETAVITKGRVRCGAFPFVVLTSNGEREFPPPLLRRCLQLDIAPPNKDVLTAIVKAHLGPDLSARVEPLITQFLERRRDRGHLANDQLLSALFVLANAVGLDIGTERELIDALFKTLGGTDVL